MTRRMLINARNAAELRVAITSDKILDDFKVDVAERGLTRGNIYFGQISNIQPSLNAAFIDYGAERNGFLTIQDVVKDAFYKPHKGRGRPRIEDVLEEGRPTVVQVTREPEGSKGAALTTNLTLAGRYLVLTPFDKTRGVSRKVDNDDDRKKLKKLANALDVPDGSGVIVRTNALDQTKTTLNRDLNALLRLWKRISTEARKAKGGKRLLYSDQDIVLQALRDYLDSSIAEVIVDEEEAFNKAQEYMRAFMPRSRTKLVKYEERVPLFSRFDIEPQIEGIYERSAGLRSGGSIVIDPTEALTAIDVNSGRSTRASSQEETALNTNLEAAAEVARQLRLRDIGGLVVVDFIDMRNRRSQRSVEKALIDGLKPDKARATVGRISPNGLIEINRQRIQQAVGLRTQRPCPTCAGTGRIPSVEILGLRLLREVHAGFADGSMGRVKILLHPETGDSFQNLQRRELAAIEQEYDVRIEIRHSHRLGRGEREIEWSARSRTGARSSAIVRKRDPKAASLMDAATEAPRRRKTRRKSKPSEGQSEELEPQTEALDQDESDASESRGTSTRKRRRTRGGRGRSRRSRSAASERTKEDGESSGEEETQKASSNEDQDTADAERSRSSNRRRSGRRRRTRSTEDSEEATTRRRRTRAKDDDAGSGDASEPASPSANDEDGESSSRTRSGRRRVGTRRRRTKRAASDNGASAEGPADTESTEARKPARTRRARTRRTTAKSSTSKSESASSDGGATGGEASGGGNEKDPVAEIRWAERPALPE